MLFVVLVTVFLLALVTGGAAQCTGNDAPACASWKANGFCTNTGYTMDIRKLYCGVICGYCNRDGTQTAAGGGSTLDSCVDANLNCASWATSPTNFCVRPDYSNAMKLQARCLFFKGKKTRHYCCKTCRPVLFATTTTHAPDVTTQAPCRSCAATIIAVTQNGVKSKPMDGDVTDRTSATCATRTFTCRAPVASNPTIEINNGAGVIQDGDDGSVDGVTTFAVTCNAAGTAWEFTGVPIDQVECTTV